MVLDMRNMVNFCDYFVICTGTSDRHVKSIAEGIGEGLQEFGINTHTPRKLKGLGSLPSAEPAEGTWVLLDLGDVVVHVFEPQAREFYALEHLWQDAPKVSIK